MNHFLATVVLAVAVVATACGDNTDSTDATQIEERENGTEVTTSTTTEQTSAPAVTSEADPVSGTDSPATPTTSTGPTDPSETSQLTEADLARFIAAAEAALADTTNRGVVVSDPETYIVLGQVACTRLSDGETLEHIAADLLDDHTIAGAVIGAASETICPEHATEW